MDGDKNSPASRYKELLDRLQSLEASHAKLQEQFKVLLQANDASSSSNRSGGSKNSEERGMRSDSAGMTSYTYPGWGDIPGAYFAGSPYRKLFECMGHAVVVTRVGSGEIVFWNRAAEELFGYKEHEALGEKDIEILCSEEYHPSDLETLSSGVSWSGQLPLKKKKSGKIFMALVTKAPLYEDGELVGIITNSQDATVLNSTNFTRIHQDNSNSNRPGGHRINLDKIQWRPHAQIAAVPHLASSVSKLASKVLRKHGEARNGEAAGQNEDAVADRPPRTHTGKSVLDSFCKGQNLRSGN